MDHSPAEWDFDLILHMVKQRSAFAWALTLQVALQSFEWLARILAMDHFVIAHKEEMAPAMVK